MVCNNEKKWPGNFFRSDQNVKVASIWLTGVAHNRIKVVTKKMRVSRFIRLQF